MLNNIYIICNICVCAIHPCWKGSIYCGPGLRAGHSPLLYNRHRFWVQSYGEINAGFADLVWKENDTWAAHVPSHKLLVLPSWEFRTTHRRSGNPAMMREPISRIWWKKCGTIRSTWNTSPILQADLGIPHYSAFSTLQALDGFTVSTSSIQKESIT